MQRSGFTLIELLVVLAILGAIATIATRSLTGFRKQKERESTTDQLEEVRQAITGSGGFLNDLGRLPIVGADPDRELIELWQIPPGIAPSHLATDAIDPDITLAVGWRGPYLPPVPGADLLLDGFSFPLRVDVTGGRFALVSLGSDGAAGESADPYSRDLETVLRDPVLGIDRTNCELSGNVEVTAELPATWIESGTLSLQVLVFAPDPATGELQAIAVTPATPDLDQSPLIFKYSFPASLGLTPGRRLIRAYLHDTQVPPTPRTRGEARSAVRTLDLVPGAQNFDLTIETIDTP